MHEPGSILQVVVVLLLATVIAVPLAKRLRLGAVIGYLAAGVIIGPGALALIAHPESMSHVSELGVVLLLFIIGLELSPKRLWVMRRAVFGTGLAQVLLCASVMALLAWLVFAQPLQTALILGLGLALSSTAFGLQLLAERRELNSPHGRQAFAVLLFQDIAAIPLIALIPLLGVQPEGSADGNPLVRTAEVLGSIAKKTGCTVKQLKRANRLKSDLIKVGQTLKVPKCSGIEGKGEIKRKDFVRPAKAAPPKGGWKFPASSTTRASRTRRTPAPSRSPSQRTSTAPPGWAS